MSEVKERQCLTKTQSPDFTGSKNKKVRLASVFDQTQGQITTKTNTSENSQLQSTTQARELRPIHSLRSSAGQTALTDLQPTDSPMSRLFREGQSAGLASVATRSIKIRALRSKTRFQKTEMSSQRSSFEEYPLTSAASTASESIKRMTEQRSLTLNV